ncbi:DUF1134 domain-containing protein [Asticcacaulis machinosus]|uniref:DUF1134 domain-containing protein n=1 Tax=Asticcacaulis machinosus TaxID=2984211 RepID=A0ABT5HHL1_9CAUL|nr:DUF1134 domain-containing protein [Asticcacaulis machinosus]MDC7675611.1 DUF1134 domain-containing protein [Asticcacaulis machinosus]
MERRQLERRQFVTSGLALGAVPLIGGLVPGLANAAPPATSQPVSSPTYQNNPASEDSTYSRDEVLNAGSNFLGVTVEALGGAIERIFGDYGDRPTAYIAGEEGSGAIGVGLRYGKGLVHMKSAQRPTTVYWQGPSIGFDTGANASRVFTLAYFLDNPEQVFRRFPGVEGSAYFIGGLGVNYQRAEGIVLAPIRAGVGFRLGANVGWLSYSKKRNILPF